MLGAYLDVILWFFSLDLAFSNSFKDSINKLCESRHYRKYSKNQQLFVLMPFGDFFSPDISSVLVVKSPIRKLVRRLENIFRDATSKQVVESKNIRKRLKRSAQLDEAAIATEN